MPPGLFCARCRGLARLQRRNPGQLLDRIPAVKARALLPVVVRVAQETTVLCLSRLCGVPIVATLAGLNAGNQYLRTPLAGRSVRMTRFASNYGVSFMAEDRVRQPARRQHRRLDARKGVRGCAGNKFKLMTFLAGFMPQQLFGLGNALLHPLAGILRRCGGQ